jgi:hypothetical protein
MRLCISSLWQVGSGIMHYAVLYGVYKDLMDTKERG